MINIYRTTPEDISIAPVYLFVTPDYMSSDFDSLEQLVDVNLDDTDKGTLSWIYGYDTSDIDIHLILPGYDDLILLATIERFDDLLTDYPELFI